MTEWVLMLKLYTMVLKCKKKVLSNECSRVHAEVKQKRTKSFNRTVHNL